MSLPVHLVPSLEGIRDGDVVEVDGDEAHHAVAVRRLRVGEQVVLTDGRGRSAVGEVASTAKRRFEVTVGEIADVPRPAPDVVVVQALPKGERGELAVSVLTEIGAARIVPWAAARSVAVWRGERAEKSLARWQATKDLNLGLNLNNLFDRKYYERSFNNVWVMPGDPRNLSVSLTLNL